MNKPLVPGKQKVLPEPTLEFRKVSELKVNPLQEKYLSSRKGEDRRAFADAIRRNGMDPIDITPENVILSGHLYQKQKSSPGPVLSESWSPSEKGIKDSESDIRQVVVSKGSEGSSSKAGEALVRERQFISHGMGDRTQ